MSHQDKMSECVTNHQSIKQVVDEFLPPRLFAGMSVRTGSKWMPRMLATAALLWGGGDGPTLVARFEQARKIVKKVFRWQGAPGETYQGFLKVLVKWHLILLAAIVPEVRARMEQDLSGCWRVAGFVVYAGDGSRFELPRTKSNEGAYSPGRHKRRRKKKTKAAWKRLRKRKQHRAKKRAAKDAGKSQSAEAIANKANSPQLWLTLLWHVGSGLPWAWRTGPSDSSERDHLREMLGELPENSLITADAGFVGFEFWQGILDAKHHFLIRVGGNVQLLKKLGYAREYDHTVYLWPDHAAKKHQPPLVLRLIVIHDGKQPVYLVTNLPKARLSDSQAATIYSKRWGIELFFRTFKQTFERRKLRSHADRNCPMELDWSVVALWCVSLLGRREIEKSGQDGDRMSAAKAIQAFRQCLREFRTRPETPDTSLMSLMRCALLDDYQRNSSKASRSYPRQKKRERTGPPKITRATMEQIQQAKQLEQQPTQFRLSA
jgi:IS4 transposase